MTTYATMRSRIEDEIARTDLTTQVNRAILSAIKFYERKKFYFNTSVTSTFSTVADQEYYGSSDLAAIPNIVEILALKGTLSGTKLPLRPTDFNTIDAAQSGAVKGFPEYFTYFAQQIRLYPMPNAAWTMTLAMVYRLTALSADADTNVWTTDAEQLIRQNAKRQLYLDVIKDREGAEIAAILEKEAYDVLRNETLRRFSNQTLATDPALVSSGSFNINYQ